MDESTQLLLKAKMDLENMAAFRAKHKEAFRVAFDLLNERFFPPMKDPEYFTAITRLMQKSLENHPGNRLLPYLNIAVLDYLAELTKDLPEEKEDEPSTV